MMSNGKDMNWNDSEEIAIKSQFSAWMHNSNGFEIDQIYVIQHQTSNNIIHIDIKWEDTSKTAKLIKRILWTHTHTQPFASLLEN